MAGPSIADRLRANVDRPNADGIRNRYALLVGIDEYEDRFLTPLKYCVRDVNKLARTLSGRGYQVKTLTDGLGPKSLPTLENVVRELGALVKRGDEDDVLLVHFSCHGLLLDGKPHLLMRDTPAAERAVKDKGLPLSKVLTILRGAPRWVAIFLDACHMGLGLDPETIVSTHEVQKRAGGFALLSGSTEGQITQDSDDLASGIFTAALIKGLSGAAADPDGKVLFSALAQHVQREVTAWRKSAEGLAKTAAQTPVVRLEVSDLAVLPPVGFIGLHPCPSQKITFAQFSADGRWLATSDEECQVRLWNPKTGEAVKTGAPMAHNGYVGGLSFSPDGILLTSVSNDGTTRVWQVPGCNLVTPTPEDQGTLVYKVAWNPKGRAWASVCAVGVLYQEVDQIGRPLSARSFQGHKGDVWAVAFLPDGERFVTGGGDSTVRVWRVSDGKCLRTFNHEGPVWAVAASPDGKTVAAAGTDANVGPALKSVPRVWDLDTGKVLFRLEGHTRGVTAIAYSPSGDRLATSSYDGTARVWSAKDGHLLATLSLPEATEAYAATFSPLGDYLFVGYADGRGVLFDVATARPDHVRE